MPPLSPHMLEAFFSAVYNDRRYQYWLLQFGGWSGFCVISFVSLTLWYSSVEWSYILHMILQAMLGMFLSEPLHYAYKALWKRSLPWRIGLSLVVIVLISLVWTVLRMYAFIWITSEEGIWEEFGGWYFSSFLVYLCWTALYYGNKYYYKAQVEQRHHLEAAAAIKEEQLKRLNAEADARQSQLGMLRYQLNPHFLFNTLNTISALVKFQENDKAHKMITQLGDFLRYSLDNNFALKITMQQEIDALRMYLDIEQTRFGDRLKLEFDVDEKAKEAMVPSLLLQPLAENAIKYAIAVNEDGGTIHLKASVEDDELKMELNDTGPGRGDGSSPPGSGRRVGLRNTLQRLKTLYNDAYVFDIGLRQCGGLKVSIQIPYEPL